MEFSKPFLFRFSRMPHDGRWAINFTRYFFMSNNAYIGEKRYYVRIGLWPGKVLKFGPVEEGRN